MSIPSQEGRDAGDLHETVVENLFDGVYYVDRKRAITYWNPAAERITGYPATEVVGRHCFDNLLGHVDDAGTQLCVGACPLVRAMAERRGIEAEVYLRHRGGHRVPVHVRCQAIRDGDGAVVGAVEIFSEDAVHREALHEIDRLRHLADTDELTGLPNRRAAELALRSRLDDVRNAGWPLALLFVDIDHFKLFNDRHGHETGDSILRVLSRSLSSCLREGDLAARWGGEEFLILTPAHLPEQVEQTAERLRHLIRSSTVLHEGKRLGVTISIGATLATAADTADALVARADEAMYRSKSAGRDRTTFAAADAQQAA